ncbi:endonuclease/exonuclease/phosphatase family protein [Parashewanella spongiae]|uniref:endonuclease/exonuclease/phosphatase family protein n=1 Tax=Parashewanella spongiae TaxID=342950 RepID=UPI00105A4C4C|nr:endonuclease/exonuclease/phosphatase family protein [Parashewanella spongiae]MCL1079763.1 endonuclease/exonuclease/phosphatase family protein [Parashewanella spongiae]
MKYLQGIGLLLWTVALAIIYFCFSMLADDIATRSKSSGAALMLPIVSISLPMLMTAIICILLSGVILLNKGRWVRSGFNRKIWSAVYILNAVFALTSVGFILYAMASGHIQNKLFDETTNVTANKVKFATYNASFDRTSADTLPAEMAAGDNLQIKHVAEVIQRTRPDVLLLNEFDHDGSGNDSTVVENFITYYLNQSQNGAEAIDYPYFYIAPTNTGLAEQDLNGDGKITLPTDAYGFGFYHGQYGFIVLSKYELVTDNLRSFQQFLWKDMPNAALPARADGTPYYQESTLEHFRLSSKNHIDLPIRINEDKTIHLLAMHPTPPVFDGDEDRNGRRNHDEIRLFSDYVSNDPRQSTYLIDDQGNKGGLGTNESFIIAGDLNADPADGDSYQFSIKQLLNHPRIAQAVATGDMIPASTGGTEYLTQKTFTGTPNYWTHLFPLRLDYVLPSADLKVVDSGVYWQAKGEKYRYLFENKAGEQGKSVSSDHRLVWVDIQFN